MSELGDKIRQHLDAAGVSQGALAERIGVTSGAVNKLVRGKSTVSVDRVVEIGQALGLSADEVAALQAAKACAPTRSAVGGIVQRARRDSNPQPSDP